MRTVGLLSGGKDSVYNLLHCVINNHEPVALASLGPGEGKDELDSYMYQTVGHSGLSSIAEALNLPLFTHTISGTAVNQEGEYGAREGITGRKAGGGTIGDETEDLYELLKKVKDAIPDIQGVACGAILSNYQRVRVEHVCSRLELTPIAYLWERNQEELLAEMVNARMESVLVKVAGAGLGVEHLGRSLAQMQPTLLRLNKKYQLHVCGEGGEYETFTLDCPLFSKRVVLSKTTTVISNEDPYSTVAHLHLDECTLIDKPDYHSNETWEEKRLRIKELVGVPLLFDELADEIQEEVQSVYGTDSLPSELQALLNLRLTCPLVQRSDAKIAKRGDWLALSEVTAYRSGIEDEVLTLEEEVKRCFSNLEALLAQHSATLLSLAHLTLYLSPSSMTLFPKINTIYSTQFGSSPPTRACVAILMPTDQNIRLKISGIANIGIGSRKSLHVQSLSYWAAANIGPYSQGVTVGERLFIAGQIALIPTSLTLPIPFDYSQEVALSLQHVRRVAQAAKEGRWKGWCEGGVCWIADCEEDEWQKRLKGARRGWELTEVTEEGPEAPILFVTAAVLPKAASIEWQVTYATGQVPYDSNVEDDGSDDGSPPPFRKIDRLNTSSGTGTQSSTIVTSALEVHTIIAIAGEGSAVSIPGKIYAINAFHLPTIPVAEVESMTIRVLGLQKESLPAISMVATSYIGTGSLQDQEIGLQIYSTLTS